MIREVLNFSPDDEGSTIQMEVGGAEALLYRDIGCYCSGVGEAVTPDLLMEELVLGLVGDEPVHLVRSDDVEAAIAVYGSGDIVVDPGLGSHTLGKKTTIDPG